ncbi:MAG TPA: hypothetical protein VFA56_07580 [Gaiellaceae bacterium]|nr:hypothetical protein [Gaiellaceae bacterium]
METTSPAVKESTASSARVTIGLVAAFVGVFIAFAAWSGSWYATWKALHVLMAIIWIGGALMIQLFAFRILKESDSSRIARFTKDVEFIGMRTFVPASLILVVLGFVLMHQGHWQWKFWAVFAIVAWALSFVSGAFFLGPESGRIGKLIDERGGVDAEIQSRIERILLHSRVEMVLIALVAMDMVLKPGA